MKKSVSKRIKVTKNGKVLRRAMRINHFRTRKTTKNIKSKTKMFGLDHPTKKILATAK